ncbi:hypothetical protein M406DRAFT_72882 [Cryphonectria parasitica EP155]|uniref:Heterokaryon incompatibility domain-containing protein n=1 Tax=Cryphonectria parasitica (strain ATCC 38755 / EP155) TaxID=660469 RepID=A0A9P4XXX7_CRYP1|nr:uncharacterized protein M406DRAFT_72882 [Cryphonectria parasitica EP155]KAF3762911.1 hypothetical protein M406DRAFT_72882 [Cryphonectria parasitica EP155]
MEEVPSLQLEVAVAQPDADIEIQMGPVAGQKLLAICMNIAADGSRDLADFDLTAFEEAMWDECCAAGAGAGREAFTPSVIQSLRSLLKQRQYKIALILFQKIKGVVAPDFLKDGADILPFALASCFRTEKRWSFATWELDSFSSELIEILPLLVEHGAGVRAFDDHGNTALFYACMLGHHKLFRKLLGQGADISTTHQFFSWREVTALNLLQATLEAFAWQEFQTPFVLDYPWRLKPGDGWRQIASDLLDAGLSCPRDDPRMVKLLQTACFQGNASWIKRLMEFGVPIDAPTVQDRSGGRFYACALHAAAAGGQADVVKLLLGKDARPQDLGLSTCVAIDKRRPRLSGESVPRKARKQTALAVAIDEAHAFAKSPYSHRWNRTMKRSESEQLMSNYWETCHVLLEVGSNPDDRAQLFEISIKHGEVSLVKRLLQMGCRLARVPDIKSFETIQLLVDHGSEFDAAQAQKSAVEKGNCELLNLLFQRWGNLVPPDELGQLAVSVITRGDMDMLDFLTSNCLGNINEEFHTRPDKDEKGETLLQIACRTGSKKTIDFLLERGANLHCPETGNNVLTTLEKTLKTKGWGSGGLSGLWSLIWLLERHMPEEAQRMRDQWRVNTQRRAPIETVINNKDQTFDYWDDHIESTNPESQLLPMDMIDGEKFEHKPLSGRDAFRTMILHPATDSGSLIECELVASDLSLNPDYETLSYVWGDSPVSRYIKLDGKVFQVKPNLYEALLALRLQSQPRHLWVDATCINQCDTNERNQQVTLMGDIYRNACRVLVWLGKASEDSHLVFQHLAEFQKHRDDVLSGRARPKDPFGESHVNPPLYQGPTLAAFRRLCRRPWFFRTWVIQEKALSKEAIICCGSDSAPWEEFFRPSGYRKEAYHPLGGLHHQSRAHQLGRLHLSTEHEAYEDLLTYSQFCQATEPKDRVYGILGLLRPGLVKVEYELDVQEIYRKFAQVIIQNNANIRLLNLCGTKKTLPGLPSWVPDFSARRSSCRLPQRVTICTKELGQWISKYLTKALPGLRVRNGGKELVIKGKAVDTVLAVGDEMPASTEYAPGTEAFSQVLSGWESLAGETWSRTQDSETGSMSVDPHTTAADAFLSTLVAEGTGLGSTYSWARLAGVIWYKRYGTGVLMEKEPRYFEDVEYCTDLSNGNRDENTLYDWYKSAYQRYALDLEKVVYGRKLFVTEGGSMGLADPPVQPGDRIVFLSGSHYPFALRPGEGDTYTLQGDCYVQGLDVTKLFDDPEKPFVDLDI